MSWKTHLSWFDTAKGWMASTTILVPLIAVGCADATDPVKPTASYCRVHEPFSWNEGDTDRTIDNIVRDNLRYDCICASSPPKECPDDLHD